MHFCCTDIFGCDIKGSTQYWVMSKYCIDKENNLSGRDKTQLVVVSELMCGCMCLLVCVCVLISVCIQMIGLEGEMCLVSLQGQIFVRYV